MHQFPNDLTQLNPTHLEIILIVYSPTKINSTLFLSNMHLAPNNPKCFFLWPPRRLQAHSFAATGVWKLKTWQERREGLREWIRWGNPAAEPPGLACCCFWLWCKKSLGDVSYKKAGEGQYCTGEEWNGAKGWNLAGLEGAPTELKAGAAHGPLVTWLPGWLVPVSIISVLACWCWLAKYNNSLRWKQVLGCQPIYSLPTLAARCWL